MAEAVVNGVRLAYDVTGDGDPVLLICGLSQPALTWQLGIAPALVDAGFQVVTFDNRGVAPSDAPPAPYTIDEMTADAAALLEQLGIAPSHVVGYSLGLWIAEVLAWQRPDLVRSAVLMGGLNRTTAWERVRYRHAADLAAAGIDLPPPAQTIELLNYLPNAALQDDDIVSGWLAMLEGSESPWPNPGRLGQWQAALAWTEDDARMARWPDIAVPTLVLAFEHDIDSPPRHAEAAAKDIPGAQFVELEGLSHLGPLERPDLVAPVLIEFMSSAPSLSPGAPDVV
jgi:pimeloyl-ACP methyl ester carboxylesterase